jgi:hypothetical protein
VPKTDNFTDDQKRHRASSIRVVALFFDESINPAILGSPLLILLYLTKRDVSKINVESWMGRVMSSNRY